MIIKKPYAFLIKNFKKIHIFLFILCSYILWKTTAIIPFMKEFIKTGMYDSINGAVSGYITFLAYIFTILIVIALGAILKLLYEKKKPWKMYILPIITYSLLFILFIVTSNYFVAYTGSTDTTMPRALKDIYTILLVPQYMTFIILLIRILGLDLNKFDFKSDEEYLELSMADQEEIEININFDKRSIKRFLKRFKRNSGYYIQEHKKPIFIICIIVLMITGWKTFEYVFIINRSYSQGDVIKTSGYEITINDSYYSNIDYNGKKISANSSFIILDVTITNKAQKRKINFSRFHIMNGINNYIPTAKTYETQFKDLGTTYDYKTINPEESYNTLLIFKVNNKDPQKRFVLYYQEFIDSNTNHLRKIKLELKDLTKINENKPINLYDSLKFNIGKEEKEIIFDKYEILDSTNYSKENCSTVNCAYDLLIETVPEGKKILKIDFASNDFDGKDMIDFLSRYGKINYIDSNNKEHSIMIENALSTYKYYGKYVYIIVPAEVQSATSIYLDIAVRNNKFKYILK